MDANHFVKEKEQHEVLVVIKTNAVVDPHTVMVELLDAGATKVAVLRAGGFRDIASVTPTKFIKDELVVAIALYSAFQVRLRSL